MARKIVITSGKGGVGKTTICANLGSYLAINYRVCLIDLDIGLNNLDVVMGVENKVVFDLVDAINNRCRTKQALIQDAHLPSLYILPSAHGNARINATQLKRIILELDSYFDYILLDCPAGIDDGFTRAVSCADEAIVVITPHMSSIRDADKVMSVLSSYRLNNVYAVINRVRGDLIVDNEMMSVEDIYQLLKIKIIGVVPDSDILTTWSVSKAKKNAKNSLYRSFELLTNNLIEGTFKIYDCTIKYRGLLGNLKRKVRKNC